ncbi:Cof-type HAD-IIB family hydrolase [Mycoplasma marinum]|uniref:Cof-type HAD-IIB family hydrolase n=1 Tax=Mycoplasma marinum TaxID=1937190 RepID=A0A4R0XU03_9MOLU|nr:Cof-type HAD-IIB family hydrolase [Mycoplasma marinum]TCG12008.1 Cof-type HAD-IIB family hydrolase [Mycoplasma marinum]
MKKEKFLFAIDLDGTLLSDSSKGSVHKVTKLAIQRARDEGHIVCIITGRPWRATQPIYEDLNLDTIVGNYNGAHIHNPSDYNFIPYINYLNLNEVMYILGDPKVQEAKSNIAIEGPGWVQLEREDEDLARVFGFNTASKLKIGIDLNKLPLKPTGIIFDTKKGVNVQELNDYLTRKYGDLAEFSSWSKGEGLTPVFDITGVGVKKSKVISLLSRYYDIHVDNVVAFGDGYNDIPMFEVAGVGVAMSNASKDIQEKALVVTHKSNKRGGVGEYINYLLDNTEKELKRVREIRYKKFKEDIKTTKAH